jgi:hypothetical protein
MNPTAINDPVPSGPNPAPLPSLPPEAASEYRSLLSELHRWCRDHDASPRLNAWVAEEAIRQLWQ